MIACISLNPSPVPYTLNPKYACGSGAGCRGMLGAKLGELSTWLEGLQRSFEAIQDFVRAYSPRLWRQEFSLFVR